MNEKPGKEQVVWRETNSGTDVIEHLLTRGGPRAAEKINTPVLRRHVDSEVDEEMTDDVATLTPMSNACYNNNFSMVQLLHEYGATCYSNSATNTTKLMEQPLFNAVKFASSLNIVQYLVQNGAKNADVCYVDNMGGTPTLFAARWNNFELIKYLTISQDCSSFHALQDTKKPTFSMRTCLGIAFQNHSFEVSQFLILVCNCLPSDDRLRCMMPIQTIKKDLIDWSFNMISELLGNEKESKKSMMEYVYATYMSSKHFQTNYINLEECFVEFDEHDKTTIQMLPRMIIAKLFRFSEQLEPKFKENVTSSLNHSKSMFKKP